MNIHFSNATNSSLLHFTAFPQLSNINDLLALSPLNRKIITGAALISFFILMHSEIFSSVLWLLHALFVLLHQAFELFELSLDLLIEHFFHTDLHTTQIIVFYLMLSMAACAIYILLRALPRWYHQSIEKLNTYCAQQKAEAFDDWHNLSFFGKIKCVLVFITGTTGAFFWLFI
jgi:hypothetical protein